MPSPDVVEPAVVEPAVVEPVVEPVVESVVELVVEHVVQPVVHVERTDDPAVLRWVCSEPSLASVAPGRRRAPSDGALGRVTEISVADGAVTARLDDAAAWSAIAPDVNAAMIEALRHRAGWLFDSPALGDVIPSQSALSAPTVAALQRVVDASAGAVAGSHGGGVVVRSVEGGTVTVELTGACHGCRLSHDTMRRLVEPAVHRAFPELLIVVD